MNHTQRKLFALFFVFLFALVAPTVVLFAQGYRFSLENNVLVHSGSITIKSWPKDIDIHINQEKQNQSLSLINGAYTINGLKPGEYTLTCSKPGYTSWEKKIAVHSGISTEFWNILLFPEKINQEVNEISKIKETKQFFLSPMDSKQLIILVDTGNERQIQLLDDKKKETKILFKTKDFSFLPKTEGLNIEWNSSSEKIIVPMNNSENELQYLIVNIKDEKTNDFLILNDFFEKEDIYQARWMFDEENELTLLTKENNLFSFNYVNQETKLIAEKVSGFDFSEYNIYYSQLPNNIIWQIKQNDLENKKQITSEPFENSTKDPFIQLTAYDKYRIFVKTVNESFLYNKDNEENIISIIQPTQRITGVQFSDDGKKLLCWNNNEVWYYMLREWEIQPKRSSGDKITVTRSAETIKNVQWMDNYENIIVSTNKNIKSFEADPRSKTNISNLFSASSEIEDKSLIYNKNNQTLYLLHNNQILNLKLLNKFGFLNF